MSAIADRSAWASLGIQISAALGALPGTEVQSWLSLSQLHLLRGAVLETAEKKSAIVALLLHPAPTSRSAEDPLTPQSPRWGRPQLEERAFLFRSLSLASAAAVTRRRGGSWEKAAPSRRPPKFVCAAECCRSVWHGLDWQSLSTFWGSCFF